MRAKKHIIEDMVFVNHLPESEDDLMNMEMARRHVQPVFISTYQLPVTRESVHNDLNASQLSRTAPSAISSNHGHRCLSKSTTGNHRFDRHLSANSLYTQRSSFRSLRDVGYSKFVLPLFFTLALIIQTLEPRVDALEANLNVTPTAGETEVTFTLSRGMTTTTATTKTTIDFLKNTSTTFDRGESATIDDGVSFNRTSSFLDVSASPSAVTPTATSGYGIRMSHWVRKYVI